MKGVQSALAGKGFIALWHPLVLVSAILFQVLYILVAGGPLRKYFPGARPVRFSRYVYFCSAMWVYYLAFGSPLDFLSDGVSFAYHMVQHLLEMLVMVPLMWLGTEDWMMRPAFRHSFWGPVLHKLFSPAVALVVYVVTFNSFHIPVVYDFALQNELFHFFEHLLFFFAAVLFWGPFLSRVPEHPKLTPGRRMLYGFYTMMFEMPLSVYLIIASQPWYAYPAHNPRLHALGLTRIADQQYGGLVMVLAMGVIYGLLIFLAFLEYDEDKAGFMA